MAAQSEHDRIRDAALTSAGFLRAEDLGVSVEAMSRMEAEGTLTRVAPAVYLGSDVRMHPLAEAAAWTLRYPDAVVGGLTAAVAYDLTDAFARGIWLIVPKGTTVPRSTTSTLQVVQAAPRFIHREQDSDNGIVVVLVHGTQVRITDRDRTVVDLWRYRQRIPREYALVALKRWTSSPEFEMPRFARIARRMGAWAGLEPTLTGLTL
jgi:predicted transcriptional regulator of viral defense system